MAALESAHLADLHELAAEHGVERYRMLRREELIEAIRAIDADAEAPERESAPAEDEDDGGREQAPRRGRRGRRDRSEDEGEGAREEEAGEPVSGVLDITPRGHGFIRVGGLDGDERDVYVSPSQIRRCELRRGDEVSGPARQPRRGERYPALIHVDTINGAEPGGDRTRLLEATPVHPSRRIELTPGAGAPEGDAILLRTIDLLWPLAHGQRVLIDAVPGAGRTTLLRALARSLHGRDDLELVVLLIDERPEEVAGWREAAPDAELAIATGEMRSGEQLRLVELAFGRATRRAESGKDVVLLVDSLSRIAVAADDPSRVKPIFGAGREIAEDDLGALTVIATALRDGGTGDAAAAALETTENVRIVLDQALASAGTFPAFDIAASRIAAEDSIRGGEELEAARALRAELGAMSGADAASRIRELLAGSADNAALLGSPPA